MTFQQATEIRLHLIQSLRINGLSEVTQQIEIALREELEQKERLVFNPKRLLIFYIDKSIEILESISNDNFEIIINKLNKAIESEVPIEDIQIQLVENQGVYSLRNLPSYRPIIEELKEIQNIILEDNDTSPNNNN
ncbi:hypothetical protein [Chryseobacterium hagamense]|uniref:Uncharacterized protein n=1 Tax=Chryseobacterium hagamense TaxID=395935 RepID=A0A511YQP0_9FLAO|nr:hypothetical protein [Chryseobacterium hagamense]GEN77513.1 hypothetical protein CHA01nite_32530 [Chryseobacterium hagamense]